MKIKEYKLVSQTGDEGNKEFSITFVYEAENEKKKKVQLTKLKQFENDLFIYLVQNKNMKALNYFMVAFKRCYKDRYKLSKYEEEKKNKVIEKKNKKEVK